jgi:hypothetical protein
MSAQFLRTVLWNMKHRVCSCFVVKTALFYYYFFNNAAPSVK